MLDGYCAPMWSEHLPDEGAGFFDCREQWQAVGDEAPD